jgi:hypothetical protein
MEKMEPFFQRLIDQLQALAYGGAIGMTVSHLIELPEWMHKSIPTIAKEKGWGIDRIVISGVSIWLMQNTGDFNLARMAARAHLKAEFPTQDELEA